MTAMTTQILRIHRELSDGVDVMQFSSPVVCVYNPLIYAWSGFEAYARFLTEGVKCIFLGMNPGPWGMAQTGIPFGEVDAVRNFLGIRELPVSRPAYELQDYPVKGLKCTRSEVSGKRLWGLFQARYGDAKSFFMENFVLNYCPLLFLAGRPGGRARNFTPDKLNRIERRKLFALCDNCLQQAVAVIRPEFVIGIGVFAASRAEEALKDSEVRVVKILHPSPASPQSNTDWAGKASRQLIEAGVWQ